MARRGLNPAHAILCRQRKNPHKQPKKDVNKRALWRIATTRKDQLSAFAPARRAAAQPFHDDGDLRLEFERVQDRHAGSRDIGGVSRNENQSMHFGGCGEQPVNER